MLNFSYIKFCILIAFFSFIAFYQKMNIPSWLTRENIQMIVIVIITFGVHYYFITNRLTDGQSEKPLEEESGDDTVILEQNTQA